MNNSLTIALQKQFNKERFNSAQYAALSAALSFRNWTGAAKYMMDNSEDELSHANKFADYMTDRGIMPVLEIVEKPIALNEDNYLLAFQHALDLEQATTEAINQLFFICESSEDPQTEQFLLWFLEEQTKSERELSDHIMMIERLDDNGLLVFDSKFL